MRFSTLLPFISLVLALPESDRSHRLVGRASDLPEPNRVASFSNLPASFAGRPSDLPEPVRLVRRASDLPEPNRVASFAGAPSNLPASFAGRPSDLPEPGRLVRRASDLPEPNRVASFAAAPSNLPASIAGRPSNLPEPVRRSNLVQRASELASQVIEQITALNSSTTSLTEAVNNFDGTPLGVLPQSIAVIAAETELDGTIVKATSLTKQSSNFTEEESSTIVTTLASLITPIQDSLTALTTKYPEFKRTLESPIVLLDLKTLEGHTDDLIAALTEKVTPSWTGFLALGQTVIDEAFDAAIVVYEG